MGKEVDSTIYNIGYPVYGAKFLDNSTLLVAGGGGEGNNGIPNKISALKVDFQKKKIVKRFRELSLDDNDDSPTTLDYANNVILIGCNEGSEKIKSGKGNNHLRKYVFHNEHLKFVASIDLDGSSKPEEYTKLTYLSPDASVAAIASSKVPTVIRIVNPTNLRETYEVETGNDVKDLHFSPDGKVLSYITASTLEVMSVVTGNFIVRKTDFDSNWKMSKIRFIDQDNVIIAATLAKGTGIVLIKVSLKSGVAKIVKSKIITSKFKGVTSLDVDPSGNLVALAGNENSVVIVTLRNFRIVKFLKQVHNFAITRLVFSPDSKLLASVSAANTVHILKVAPNLATSRSLMESFLTFLTNSVLVVVIAAAAYYVHEHNLHLKALDFMQEKYKKYMEKNDSSDYFVLHEYPQQTTLIGVINTDSSTSGCSESTTLSFHSENTVGPMDTSADDFISYATDTSLLDSEYTVNTGILDNIIVTKSKQYLSLESTEKVSFTSIIDEPSSGIIYEKINEDSLDHTDDITTHETEPETIAEGPSETKDEEEYNTSNEPSLEKSNIEEPVTVVVKQAKTRTDLDLTPENIDKGSSEFSIETEDIVPEEIILHERTDKEETGVAIEKTEPSIDILPEEAAQQEQTDHEENNIEVENNAKVALDITAEEVVSQDKTADEGPDLEIENEAEIAADIIAKKVTKDRTDDEENDFGIENEAEMSTEQSSEKLDREATSETLLVITTPEESNAIEQDDKKHTETSSGLLMASDTAEATSSAEAPISFSELAEDDIDNVSPSSELIEETSSTETVETTSLLVEDESKSSLYTEDNVSHAATATEILASSVAEDLESVESETASEYPIHDANEVQTEDYYPGTSLQAEEDTATHIDQVKSDHDVELVTSTVVVTEIELSVTTDQVELEESDISSAEKDTEAKSSVSSSTAISSSITGTADQETEFIVTVSEELTASESSSSAMDGSIAAADVDQLEAFGNIESIEAFESPVISSDILVTELNPTNAEIEENLMGAQSDSDVEEKRTQSDPLQSGGHNLEGREDILNESPDIIQDEL
ncbi:Sec12/Sed4 [Kluyveromyces lactis]|nr:Sec12/Sed4 [Kluyveromyces lactis]